MTKGRKITYEERVEIVSYCIEHGIDYTVKTHKKKIKSNKKNESQGVKP